MAKIGPEDIIQITVMDWVRFNKLDKFIFHVANERATTVYAGSILKRKGVLSGVSDILVLRASEPYHGAAIELKSPNGKLSTNQKTFLETLENEGYFTAVCYSSDEAIKTIQNYLQT